MGVVEDGKYHNLMESPEAAVFVPLSQDAASEVVLVVRSSLAPKEVAAALRETLSRVQPNVPATLSTWPDALERVLYPARAAAFALGVMGLFAVMLAVTGIFGMAAHSVSRRVRELSIRRALGAREAQVVIAAVGRPGVLLGVGSALGLLVSRLRDPPAGAHRLSGGSHPSRGVGRRSAGYGADRHLRVCHSRPARSRPRSLETHAR